MFLEEIHVAGEVFRAGRDASLPAGDDLAPGLVTRALAEGRAAAVVAVADEAGWDLEFVEAPFDSIFPALDSGRVDVIGAGALILDRIEQLLTARSVGR
mgnify:CR=1 FL=1